ncbi:hypothetical protein ACQ4LE_002992 [Meloidogyne hapla]|uniref:DUF4347 domain-containing protein n=1 Tax=Meloidogyne hapla TaxID=6305 RepID=A0A1I8C2D4_MELHA
MDDSWTEISMECNSGHSFKIREGDKTTTYYVPPTKTLSEVAEELKLESDVVDFIGKLEYDEEEPPYAVLVIDFLQMTEEQKQTILQFLVKNGATLVGHSGTVFKFDSWSDLIPIPQKLRKAHPWAIYSNNSYLAHVFSKTQTASTVVIEPFYERFEITKVQFFKV